MDSDYRERSGHESPRTNGRVRALRVSVGARLFAAPPRVVHLGRGSCAGGAPRRDSRVSLRDDRQVAVRGREALMAVVRIPAEGRTLDGPESVTAFLADHGIVYE